MSEIKIWAVSETMKWAFCLNHYFRLVKFCTVSTHRAIEGVLSSHFPEKTKFGVKSYNRRIDQYNYQICKHNILSSHNIYLNMTTIVNNTAKSHAIWKKKAISDVILNHPHHKSLIHEDLKSSHKCKVVPSPWHHKLTANVHHKLTANVLVYT